MFGLNVNDLAKGLIPATILAALSFIATIVLSYFSISGSIYVTNGIASNAVDRSIVIIEIIETKSTGPFIFTINRRNAIISSSKGNASIETQSDARETHTILKVNSVAALDGATITIDSVEKGMIVRVVEYPNGYLNVDRLTPRLFSHQNIAYILVIFITLYISHMYNRILYHQIMAHADNLKMIINENREHNSKIVEDIVQKRDKLEEANRSLTERIANNKTHIDRMKLFYTKSIRDLHQEVDFWREVMRRLAYQFSSDKELSRKLVSIVSKKFNSSEDDENRDLLEIHAILADLKPIRREEVIQSYVAPSSPSSP